jgi:hypothetical protein
MWAGGRRAAAATNPATAFRPVDPAELKMTSEPAAPGAPAIILCREVYRDDLAHREGDYFRIKILTEEGRKYADVEIPFFKDEEKITGISARTIKPDGSIVDYDGNVVTKTVVKARGFKYLAKTFTLPAVQAGCVIEYYYTREFTFIFDSHWILSGELFTKNAKFSLKPTAYLPYRTVWRILPLGTPPPQEQHDHSMQMELSNIPAFQTEDFMPPENELKSQVEFIYTNQTSPSSPGKFWSDLGKQWNAELVSFVEKHKAIDKAVAEMVGPNDPPEVKLQKIYARVQSLRNTSNEEEKTGQEQQREKEKAAASVEDVWKHGYGDGAEITWLYLALVRAAGFEAYGVWVPSRDRYFFDPNLMEPERLDNNVVLIKLNGKEVWCDPGWAFTPFGLLPWPETGVQGLQLDKNSPTWVNTLAPTADQARIQRHADLTLSDAGDLAGTLTVTFTGLEAARMRLDERDADVTERQTYLQDIVKGYIPTACEVKLTNQPEWKNAALPLVAEFGIKVPGWASGAGHHLIVPVGLFSAREKHVFDHVARVHPIYVEYPYTESDDINIQIPAGWQVSSLPRGWQNITPNAISYSLTAASDKGKLHLSRTLTIDFILLQVRYYSALRQYFQEIKTTDDQQIVLDSGAARAAN